MNLVLALSLASNAFGLSIVSPNPPVRLPPCAPKACVILSNFNVPNSDNSILCPTTQRVMTPNQTFALYKSGLTKNLKFILVMKKINSTGAYGKVGEVTFPISYNDDKCLAGYKGIIPSNLKGRSRDVSYLFTL